MLNLLLLLVFLFEVERQNSVNLRESEARIISKISKKSKNAPEPFHFEQKI